MLKCIAELQSASPMLQSRFHGLERDKNQTWEEFERAIYKQKLHVDDQGRVKVPAATIKKSLMFAANYLKRKIKGEGVATYGKRFRAGLLVPESMILNVTRDQVEECWIPCSSQPSKVNSPLVTRCFPLIRQWSGIARFVITDDKITKEEFSIHLRAAGMHDGFGSFRVGNGGSNGAFEVLQIEWE